MTRNTKRVRHMERLQETSRTGRSFANTAAQTSNISKSDSSSKPLRGPAADVAVMLTLAKRRMHICLVTHQPRLGD